MYRIGNECFLSKQEATDYKMSLVIPQITADGKLLYPIKHEVSQVWTFNGEIVQPSFGTCNPEQDFYNGAQISAMFASLFALAFFFKFLAKFLWAYFSESEHDRD